jgi:hypothetical protein
MSASSIMHAHIAWRLTWTTKSSDFHRIRFSRCTAYPTRRSRIATPSVIEPISGRGFPIGSRFEMPSRARACFSSITLISRHPLPTEPVMPCSSAKAPYGPPLSSTRFRKAFKCGRFRSGPSMRDTGWWMQSFAMGGTSTVCCADFSAMGEWTTYKCISRREVATRRALRKSERCSDERRSSRQLRP